MKNLFSVVLTTIFISLTLLTSCAREGFQTNNVSLPSTGGNNNGSNNGGGNNNPDNPTLQDQINRLDMGTYLFSCILCTDPSKAYLVADLDKTGKGQIIINIPLGLAPLFTIGSGKYKEITFSIQGSVTTGFSLSVRIPLKYILRLASVENAAPGLLPNGDPIPDVPGGELPKLNIIVNSTKKEKIHLYLSKEYVGVLFESKFDPVVNGSFPLMDRNDLNTLGYFHIISAKNNAPAAFLLLLKFNPQISTLLDDYFLN